jgi:MYXO-CTERM domain-containing protein
MKVLLLALAFVLMSPALGASPTITITDPASDYSYFQWDPVSTDIAVSFQIDEWTLSGPEGRFVRGYLDGLEQGLVMQGNSFVFKEVPHGQHQLCCALVEQGDLLDSCDASACVHVRVQRPCAFWDDPICDDGNPCSLDGCLQHSDNLFYCRYGTPVGQVGCCKSDLDCPCVKLGADSFFLACKKGNSCDPCQDVFCDDGIACTEDSCDPATGGCRHLPIANLKCCSGDPDPVCDDGNVCTQDRCIAKACRHGPVSDPLCCNNDSECDDGNPCTDELCLEHNRCQFVDNDHENCCLTHPDCGPGGPWDDGDPNTNDYCQNFQCVHVLPWNPCEDYCFGWSSDPCKEYACVGQECQLVPVAGCGADAMDAVAETVSDVVAADSDTAGTDTSDIAQDLTKRDTVDIAKDLVTDTVDIAQDLAAPDAPNPDLLNPTDLPKAQDTHDADAATEQPPKKASSGCNSGEGGGGSGGLLLALVLAVLGVWRRRGPEVKG